MNYIKQITAFFQRTSEDHGLNATHVSLYMALFQFWNLNRFHNPISIARNEAMQISKIGSKSTYHKCMQELHRKKYIIYEPSCNPLKGSIVRMIDFEAVDQAKVKNQTSPKSVLLMEQLQERLQTGIETTTKQPLVPYINKTNNKNNSKIKKQLNHLNTLTHKNYEEPL